MANLGGQLELLGNGVIATGVLSFAVRKSDK